MDEMCHRPEDNLICLFHTCNDKRSGSRILAGEGRANVGVCGRILIPKKVASVLRRGCTAIAPLDRLLSN